MWWRFGFRNTWPLEMVSGLKGFLLSLVAVKYSNHIKLNSGCTIKNHTEAIMHCELPGNVCNQSSINKPQSKVERITRTPVHTHNGNVKYYYSDNCDLLEGLINLVRLVQVPTNISLTSSASISGRESSTRYWPIRLRLHTTPKNIKIYPHVEWNSNPRSQHPRYQNWRFGPRGHYELLFVMNCYCCLYNRALANKTGNAYRNLLRKPFEERRVCRLIKKMEDKIKTALR